MMDNSSFIGIIIFSAIVSLTPGPNNLMLAASAANFGFLRTVPHICGVVCGFTFMVLATGFGLGGLIKAFPAFHNIMRIFSILFLLYLSWRIAMTGKPSDQTSGRPLSFFAAALFQLINPKGLSFLVSIMAVHISAGSSILPQVLPFAIMLPSLTILSTVSWSLFGTMIGRLLANERSLRIFNMFMAALLVVCIVPIALT
ncbi:MAG: lysine transporter LysE [Rhodospirillaceae bacterium]|nr:lysine transporter LysE [Rhodospirillaceae bacterium]|tara:strand:- start:140 stop:739 length:600 start_codon:yes stop_codon:yes gene_type:complete